MDAGALRSRWPLAVTAVAVALVVVACAGGAPGPILSNVGNSVEGQPAASAAPSGAAYDRLAPAAPAGASTGGESTAQVTDGPQIIKTGSLSLQVDNLDSALSQANTAITGLGGYVSGSQRSNEGEQSTASVTYRIPAAHWDAALAALHKLASRILNEQTNAVDVTGQVLDLGARIDNLQVTEKALQTIMAKATRIADVLDVQSQLTDVRGQIEQLQTEQKHLQDQAAYGTLAVSYNLPVVAVTVATRSWDPGAELDRAVAQLVEVGQALATGGLWFVVVWLPILLLLAVASLIAWAIFRRARSLRADRGRPSPPAEPPLSAVPGA